MTSINWGKNNRIGKQNLCRCLPESTLRSIKTTVKINHAYLRQQNNRQWRKTEMQSAKTHTGPWIHHTHDNSSPKCQENFSHSVHATFMPRQQEPISAKTVATGAFEATVSFQAETGAELPGKETCFRDARKLASGQNPRKTSTQE